MQLYRQLTNRLEQKLSYRNALSSLLSKFTMSKLALVLAICLFTFTSLLVKKTLQIQHSCYPMIYYDQLPAECQVANNDLNPSDREKATIPQHIDSKPIIHKTITKPQTKLHPQPNQMAYDSQVSTAKTLENDKETESKNVFEKAGEFARTSVEVAKDNPLETGAAVGLIAGAGVTIVTASPALAVMAAVALGAAVWQGLKSIF